MFYALMLTGKLGWNLAQRVSHGAGGILEFTVTITNITEVEREYKVWIGLFTLEGSVITTFPLEQTFTVGAGATVSFKLTAKVDYSDCILQASLYDIATGEMGAALQTILEQPPSPIEQVTPAITSITGIAAMGMIISIIPGMLEGGG